MTHEEAADEATKQLLQRVEAMLETATPHGEYAKAVAYGHTLLRRTTNPHMREKIATALTGRSVSH